MFLNKEKLLTDTEKLLHQINEIFALIHKSELKSKKNLLMDFQLLKIGFNNFSLGLARTQVRLNANQLNNAISKEIDLHGNPDDPANKSTYLNSETANNY